MTAKTMTNKELLEEIPRKRILRIEQYGDDIVIFLVNGMKIFLKNGATVQNKVK